MTNPISQAAFNAAVAAIQDVTADDKSIVKAALEAAMPHLRKQIGFEIRAARADDEVWAESVKAYHAAGYTQPPDDYDRMFWDAGMADAARTAEKGLEQ